MSPPFPLSLGLRRLKAMDESQPGVDTNDGGTGRSFVWQKLCLDSEEICKARFRRLLENNSGLKRAELLFLVDVFRNTYQACWRCRQRCRFSLHDQLRWSSDVR